MERIAAVGALASALAPGKLKQLDELISRIIPQPLPAKVGYEIVLQSHLFFGYAQTIEAARIFAVVMSQKGIAFNDNPADRSDPVTIRKRGEELCREIYRPNYRQLLDNMSRISPELAEWMVVDGYGKVLSRPGPTAIEREVASIIFLACSGHPVQLYSHVRGARNLGASREQILAAVVHAGMSDLQFDLIQATLNRVFQG